MTTGLDLTYHAHGLFLVSHFNFLFVPCVGLTRGPIYKEYYDVSYDSRKIVTNLS